MRSWVTLAAIGFSAIALVGNRAEARITRIDIVKSEPAFGGATFGDVGQYEHLFGRVNGELDPADPANAIIQDISLAPRNERGMVEYSDQYRIAEASGHGARQSDLVVRGQQPRQQARVKRLQRRRPRDARRSQCSDFGRRRLVDARRVHDGLVRLGNGRSCRA